MFKFIGLTPTASFIKLVEGWSFCIDLYGGNFFLPTGRQKVIIITLQVQRC